MMKTQEMKYSVCVATDCDMRKINLRFLFDSSGPSVTKLLHRAFVAFNNFFCNYHIHRTFAFNGAVVFNDVGQRWDRLERSTQLLHNSQVYLFQPDILDLPAEIPEPFEAFPLIGDGYISPERDSTDSPRAPTPSYYDTRPPFSHESPQMMCTPLGNKRKKSLGRIQKSSIADRVNRGVSSHYYNVKDHPERDAWQLTSPAVANRIGGSELYKEAASTCNKTTYTSSNSSPIPECPKNLYYIAKNNGKSIIRDERDKIEYLWRLSIDEMRRSMREETLQLERSISPVRRVL